MDIRKADSKGRMTGFHPGRHYSVVQDGGSFKVESIMDPSKAVDYDQLIPEVSQPLLDFLAENGLDPYTVSRENVTREGYDCLVLDEEGKKVKEYGLDKRVRKPWPEGFDWNRFVYLATGYEIHRNPA